jgi:hypothetical protein
MKRLAVFLGFLMSIAGSLLAFPVGAADNTTVNATVQPLLLAVSVSQSSVNYGTKTLGATGVASSPMYVTVNNDGSVAEKFNVKGANSSGGWQLGATQGTNTYVHRVSTDGSSFTALTTSDNQLISNIPSGSNFNLYFQLDLPTSPTSITQQILPVTITALQYP